MDAKQNNNNNTGENIMPTTYTERTWTVTLPSGAVKSFRECSATGLIEGLEKSVFFAGLDKMRDAGASVTVKSIDLTV